MNKEAWLCTLTLFGRAVRGLFSLEVVGGGVVVVVGCLGVARGHGYPSLPPTHPVGTCDGPEEEGPD